MSETYYGYRVKADCKFFGSIENSQIRGALRSLKVDDAGETVTLEELEDRGKRGDVQIKISGPGDGDENPEWHGKIAMPVVDERYCRIISEGIAGIRKIHTYEKKDGLFELDVSVAKVPPGATHRVKSYGTTQLECGPGAVDSEWIILVEGRWDVMNMNDAGYDNTLAFDGSKLFKHKEKIKEIRGTKKHVLAFLDGDSGAKTNRKNLEAYGIRPDVYLNAPRGTEVEDLTLEEVYEIVEPEAGRIRADLGVAGPAKGEYWERPADVVWPDFGRAEPPAGPSARSRPTLPQEPTLPKPEHMQEPELPWPEPPYAAPPRQEQSRAGLHEKPGSKKGWRRRHTAALFVALFAVASMAVLYMGADVPLAGMAGAPPRPETDDSVAPPAAPEPGGAAPVQERVVVGGRLGPDDPPELGMVVRTRIAQVTDVNTMRTGTDTIMLALVDNPGSGGPRLESGMASLAGHCPRGSWIYYDRDGIPSDGLLITKVWCTGKITGIPSHSINEIILDEGLAGLHEPHCPTRFGAEQWARDAGC